MIGLTQAICLEYAKKNIRANAVCPGYVDTPHLDFLSQEEKDNISELHPMGRLAQPEEIAKAVVFLTSEDSSFVTGSSLCVDGGYAAQQRINQPHLYSIFEYKDLQESVN